MVLAAGPSRRFGDDPPKQLALIDGETLVHRLVRRAATSRLTEIVVVVGLAAHRVEGSLRDLSVTVARNRDYMQGQSTSVKAGLAAISPDAAAAMFIPVDQPALSAAVIDALVDCYQRSGGSIVVPTHGGQRGAPVLFDRTLFGELAVIEGDVGGRQIFVTHEQEIVELPLASPEPLRDLDTAEDLYRWSP